MSFYFKSLTAQPQATDTIALYVPGTTTPITGTILALDGVTSLANPFTVTAAGGLGTWGFIAPNGVPFDLYWVTEAELLAENQVDIKLTTDELAAVNGANAPTAANPFATTDDVVAVTETFSPASIDVTAGTLNSGTVASLLTPNDGGVVSAQEVTGVGLTLQITFTGITSFNLLSTHSRYAGGSGHIWQWQLYNNTLAAWESMSETLGAEPELTWHNISIPDSSPYINAGTVLARFYHTGNFINAHYALFDYAALVQTQSGVSDISANKVRVSTAGGITEMDAQSALEGLDTRKADIASGYIQGQMDVATSYTAVDASTVTIPYSVGNAAKIDASALLAGAAFTITVTGWPTSGTRYGLQVVRVLTGANVPTVSYTGIVTDAPTLAANEYKTLILTSWDAGASLELSEGPSYASV